MISFEGNLVVPTPAGGSTAPVTYYFSLAADDGANLYITKNGTQTQVVNNDGIHAITTTTGSIDLAPGTYPIRVDYYQGPRYYIACEVGWTTTPGQTAPYPAIPAANLTGP
jgi:hypothetical protein